MKNYKYIFFGFIGLFVLFFSYIVLSPILNQNSSLTLLLYSAGKLAGLIGFLFLSILIISGDTARFFDRFFGMDSIIKFQRKFALVTTFFVLFHPVFFIISDYSFLNYLIPYYKSIPLMLGTLALYFYIVVMICSLLYKKISYQIWQYIHVLTYVLFFFGIFHAFGAGSDVNNIFIKFVFRVLLVGVILGLIYRTYYKINAKKFRCYVDGVKWETSDTFTLKLKPNKKMNFKAGQFCFLRINDHRLYARHPLTISNFPNDDTLNFTIKINGKFTKKASQLKNGEEVIVDGPFGIFTIDDKDRDLVFIAGGVGITPFMSIIRDHLHFHRKQKITLLYGAKMQKDIIFKDELDRIKNNWFSRVYILSKEKNKSKGFRVGYIDEKTIRENVSDLDKSLFFICGPEVMKNKVVDILKDMGVKNDRIKVESFFW